jgi:hypothetical protein
MSKAMCASCGDIIESKHRHDFIKCKCGQSFLDGGDDYIRGGGYLIFVADDGTVELPEDFDDDSFLDKD